jgi:hypothetical protein
MLWRDRWLGNLKHFVRVESAHIGVLSFELDVAILSHVFSTLYMFSAFVWRIPKCVLNFGGGQIRGVQEDTGRRLSRGLEIQTSHSPCACHIIYVCGLRSASNSGLGGQPDGWKWARVVQVSTES